MHLNLIEKDKLIEHYRELSYDPNVPQHAVEDTSKDTGVDSIIFEELKAAILLMKNQKAVGLN